MPILNYTTKIDSTNTIAEITNCLIRHGANKIVTDYEGSVPIAVTFWLIVNDNMVAFSLPCNYAGVLKVMEKDHNVPYKFKNKAQAVRVSWRIIKSWVDAQMAIVEAQLVDMAEVFLPYAVTKNGSTLYKEIKNGSMNLLA